MASIALLTRLLSTWRISPSKQRTGAQCAYALLDTNPGIHDAALVKRKNAINQLLAGDRPGTAGLLVKAEGLIADGRDPAQLALGGMDVLLDLFRIAAAGGKIQQIGERLQRVINLVRDGCREAAHDGQLFALDQRHFSLFLLGDFERRRSDRLHRSIGGKNRKIAHRPVTVLSRARDQFPLQRDS